MNLRWISFLSLKVGSGLQKLAMAWILTSYIIEIQIMQLFGAASIRH
jgi:hypothetical protein